MELFYAPGENAPLYFRNLVSPAGYDVAFVPSLRAFLQLSGDVTACANRAQIGCNWAAQPNDAHCISCAMTTTVPELSYGDNLRLWADAEAAKRWVIAGLMRWGFYLPGDRVEGPNFKFLSEKTSLGDVDVIMGHENGVVTINVLEADAAISEERKQRMAERYRTMTGHIRHELGHAVFMRLTALNGFLAAFRTLFGDETLEYKAALERHYQYGPPADFAQRHLTAYASAHPHEDWAETFAHYLHLVDMLDSARAANLVSYHVDPYVDGDVDHLLSAAAKIGIALNHVNRSMGMSDLYPFVFSPITLEKLGFVHHWVRQPARHAFY